MYTIEAHTDGSCLGNPGPGGWAVEITKVFKDGRLLIEGEDTFSGACAYLTTNNAMEINAVNNLLNHINTMGYPEGTLVKVYVDSEYVLKVVRMGEHKATDPSRANHQYWSVFFDLVNGFKYKVEFYWEKAHANNCCNNRVNDVAQRRAKLAKEKMDFESKL